MENRRQWQQLAVYFHHVLGIELRSSALVASTLAAELSSALHMLSLPRQFPAGNIRKDSHSEGVSAAAVTSQLSTTVLRVSVPTVVSAPYADKSKAGLAVCLPYLWGKVTGHERQGFLR